MPLRFPTLRSGIRENSGLFRTRRNCHQFRSKPSRLPLPLRSAAPAGRQGIRENSGVGPHTDGSLSTSPDRTELLPIPLQDRSGQRRAGRNACATLACRREFGAEFVRIPVRGPDGTVTSSIPAVQSREGRQVGRFRRNRPTWGPLVTEGLLGERVCPDGTTA